jgi:hypothetical protein
MLFYDVIPHLCLSVIVLLLLLLYLSCIRNGISNLLLEHNLVGVRERKGVRIRIVSINVSVIKIIVVSILIVINLGLGCIS